MLHLGLRYRLWLCGGSGAMGRFYGGFWFVCFGIMGIVGGMFDGERDRERDGAAIDGSSSGVLLSLEVRLFGFLKYTFLEYKIA